MSNPPVRRLADWSPDRLGEVAAEFGTPLYITDLDRVVENCERLLGAFPAAQVLYAAKAHTGRAVLETVREAGLDVECASAGEVARALEAGFPGERVHYTAVNPPGRDLASVVDAWTENPGLTVVAGSADTVDRLRERGYDGRLALRVDPGVGAGHHEKVTTGGNPKFGVPLDRVEDLVADARDDFDLVGLHAHAGSGISPADLDAHRELVRRMGDLAGSVARDGVDLEFVDVGGGFGVPYREDEPAFPLADVAAATRDAFGDVDATLAVEPGRYVVADAGVLLTRVNTVKPAGDVVVAGVDAGMTDLLRPAMYAAYHPIRNLGGGDDKTPANRPRTAVTVAGPVCESGDVLCEDRALPQPARGDLLAVGFAGAYGYEMALQYNSRPRPAEASLAGDLLRRRESIDDLTAAERPM